MTAITILPTDGYVKIAENSENYKAWSTKRFNVTYTAADSQPATSASYIPVMPDTLDIRAGIDGYAWARCTGDEPVTVNVFTGVIV